MRGLVAERFNPAIHSECVLKEWKLEREEILQPCAWQIRLFSNHILGGVTLKTDIQRLVLGKSRQSPHPHASSFLESRLTDYFNMTPARTVTRFPIDLQALKMRVLPA